ncbi:hypothetical protein HOLleu_16282 [Holothuria leucospilota]|uniref:Uncharacterized protein n=1 Tax=Holothuria leucospilota TaxID=206669 RepID=A0A9Q1HB14_HOLLE|nr:hypothetical protein HOLleu_16282 [Holothuria leucospilota]
MAAAGLGLRADSSRVHKNGIYIHVTWDYIVIGAQFNIYMVTYSHLITFYSFTLPLLMR